VNDEVDDNNDKRRSVDDTTVTAMATVTKTE
jgi:hypothetical protein